MSDDSNDLGLVPVDEKSSTRTPASAGPDDVNDLGLKPVEGNDDLGLVPEEGQTSTLGSAAEGFAKGVISRPLTAAAELGLSKLGVSGLSAEEQQQREKEHPYAEGLGEAAGFIAPAILSGGVSAEARAALEAGTLTADAAKGTSALAKIAQYGTAPGLAEMAAGSIAKSAGLGKVATSAINMALQGEVFHVADNATKMILGQTDPGDPVSSLLAGSGAALILGGGLGGVTGALGSKLSEIASSKAANKYSQEMANFANGVLTLHENPNPVEAAANEAANLHEATTAAINGGYALKRQVVDKLTGSVTPEQVAAHLEEMKSIIDKAPRAAKASPAFQDAVEKFEAATAHTPSENMFLPATPASASDVFNATDQLKRDLGDVMFKHNADPSLVSGFGPVYNKLKLSLENGENWGDMGTFQEKLNKIFSDLQQPTKDFHSAVSGKLGGDSVVNPDKVRTLVKQIANEQGSLRQEKVLNYIPLAKKALETVDELHSSMGLESNIPKVSTNTLDELMSNSASPGLKMARLLFTKGPGSIGWAASHAVGTAVGALTGHPYLGYRAGEHLAPILSNVLGNKVTRWGTAGIMRALAAGDYAAIPEAANYAQRIAQGANLVETSINNVFKVGGVRALHSDFSEKDREKLKKHIEDGSFNQQLQAQKNAGPAPTPPPVQGFAHGGMVMAPEPVQPTTKRAAPVLQGIDRMSGVFPEQGMLLGAAKGRVNNYLNSIRPQKVQAKLPFDDHVPDKHKEKSYNRALDLANKPLSIMDHVKNGTLSPEDMSHMKGLYPEMLNHLQKKVTERLTKAQMENEKPPAKVRQSLSLFMGAALESNITPQSIQAAQSAFMANKAPAQQPEKPAPISKTSKLSKMGASYRTPEQAALSEQTVKA
jgi:hypothetical protein